jgi:hypothetical protein
MRMKIFSPAGARPPLHRRKAWTCLLINALICPGLGSLVARRASGWLQLILAWGGAIWMVLGMVRFFQDYVQFLQIPPEWPAYMRTARTGFVIFLVGWAWSVATGVLVLRQAKPQPPPAPPDTTEDWSI